VGNQNMGPAREIHAGSGYWSQDSAIQIPTLAGVVRKIWLRWPGGQTNLVDVPSGAREVVAEMSSSAAGRP